MVSMKKLFALFAPLALCLCVISCKDLSESEDPSSGDPGPVSADPVAVSEDPPEQSVDPSEDLSEDPSEDPVTAYFSEDMVTVGWQGGTVVAEISWNGDYSIVVQEEWVKQAETKAAMNTGPVCFVVDKNMDRERSCIIELATEEGITGHTTVVQQAYPLTEEGIFGVYGTSGSDFEYRRGFHQMSAFVAEDLLYFRFISPSEVKICEIEGIPAEVSPGLTCPLTITTYSMGEKVSGEGINATVEGVEDSCVKLRGERDEAIIIRR